MLIEVQAKIWWNFQYEQSLTTILGEERPKIFFLNEDLTPSIMMSSASMSKHLEFVLLSQTDFLSADFFL